MKTSTGEDISAKRAAQIITYKHGIMWEAMGDDEIGQAIDVPRVTEKQMTALRDQLVKMKERLTKLCKI